MQLGEHFGFGIEPQASLAQLVEHALRKRMVVGSIPTGGLLALTERDAKMRQGTHTAREVAAVAIVVATQHAK